MTELELSFKQEKVMKSIRNKISDTINENSNEPMNSL